MFHLSSKYYTITSICLCKDCEGCFVCFIFALSVTFSKYSLKDCSFFCLFFYKRVLTFSWWLFVFFPIQINNGSKKKKTNPTSPFGSVVSSPCKAVEISCGKTVEHLFRILSMSLIYFD